MGDDLKQRLDLIFQLLHPDVALLVQLLQHGSILDRATITTTTTAIAGHGVSHGVCIHMWRALAVHMLPSADIDLVHVYTSHIYIVTLKAP